MVDNNPMGETLSAFMDNEADELGAHRLLKAASGDEGLRDQWHRYQLASSAMRRDLPPRVVDLSDRIRAAIDEEPEARPSLSRILHPLGKVAIAASVAVVAVLGVQQLQPVGSGPQVSGPAVAQGSAAPESVDASPQFQLPAGYDYPPVGGRTVSAGSAPQTSSSRPVLMVKQVERGIPSEEEIEHYLNLMMQRHTENAVSTRTQGVLPYGRLPQEVSDGP